MRSRFTITVVLTLIVASCGSDAGTPSPAVSAPSTGPPSGGVPTQTILPSATAAQTAGPEPITSGRWVEAGTMALGRLKPQAVRLGDGTVLVLGNDGLGCVRDDSVRTEIWQAATGTWATGPRLNKPRGEFAVARMTGGGAMVAGGVNAGTGGTGDEMQSGHQAYSSTYAYDPANAAAGWVRSGLLGTARVAPATATLPDGRVLVAGGYYLSGTEGEIEEAPGEDLGVIPEVPAMTSAELHDPATGAWSTTGRLRSARYGAAAVTLTDGRVLIVGSADDMTQGWRFERWDGIYIYSDDPASLTAEVFDPGTGRFTLLELPPWDWSSIADLGEGDLETPTSLGELVVTSDGGAVLVGQGAAWMSGSGHDYVQAVRTLRFDPVSETWTSVDQRIFLYGPGRALAERVTGHSREGSMVARLADGKLLIAGGEDFATGGAGEEDVATGRVTSAAELYDPAADTWSELPAMPEQRAWGTAVTMPDGSVILIGGSSAVVDVDRSIACSRRSAGLASTIRFEPQP